MNELNETQERLRKKYFPHIPWTDNGPVRRVYRVRGESDAGTVLSLLAQEYDFAVRAIIGGPEECLTAMQQPDAKDNMIFGTGTDCLWCDAAIGSPDEDGWQLLIVRSEMAENLIALAHEQGLLRFRRAEL